MRRALLLPVLLLAIGSLGPITSVSSEEPKAPVAKAIDLKKAAQALAGLEPVMVDVTEGEPPSKEEWDSLHEEKERGMLGSLADFRSRTVAFMNTRYFTANPAEGTLASYGKMGSDKRYDRFGHIEHVAFSIEQNSWKQRHVLNAAALFKLAGGRFMEFAGVGVDVAAADKRQIDVTFVGTTVPKDEAIRRLNADPAALAYLGTLAQKQAEGGGGLFGAKPPAPRVVLSNVVMLNGNFSQALDASVDGKLHNRVVGDSVELKVVKQNGEQVTLMSPVVRCYRTFAVEFKTDANKQPMRFQLRDAQGVVHVVPQVFDLTPDL